MPALPGVLERTSAGKQSVRSLTVITPVLTLVAAAADEGGDVSPFSRRPAKSNKPDLARYKCTCGTVFDARRLQECPNAARLPGTRHSVTPVR